MANLVIEKTDITPEIILDSLTNEIRISGVCLPENARDFFKPVLEWVVEELDTKVKSLVGSFNLTYFNSSTSKQLLKLFYILEDASEANVNIEIDWFYNKDDYMILEKGQQFNQMTALNFNFKKIE
ncbi:MAG: DUF1987 domain-containing protein [Crocinitomicaceae bacterium]